MKQSIIAIFLLLTLNAHSQSQDSLVWLLRGELQDKSAKAFYVSGKNVKSQNVIVFKKGEIWDTMNLDDYYQLYHRYETCMLQSVNLDGQGLNELVITWQYRNYEKNAQVQYTYNEIWDLDAKKKIFYCTSEYFRIYTETIYDIDINYNILDSTLSADSCIFNCDFTIEKAGQVTIKNVVQIGYCPDNQLWKRDEGVYIYKDGYLKWERENSN